MAIEVTVASATKGAYAVEGGKLTFDFDLTKKN